MQNYAEEVNDPSSPNYHQFLTHDQAMEEFGPNTSDMASVSQFLLNHGIQSQPTSDGSGLSCTVSSGLIDRIFGTTMHSYTRNGQNFIAPAGSLTLPDALSSVIYVEGLDTYHPVYNNLTTPPGTIRNGATETQEGERLAIHAQSVFTPSLNKQPSPAAPSYEQFKHQHRPERFSGMGDDTK